MEMNPNFSANAQNDFNLVREAKEGDQKAYTKLMKRYERSVYFMSLKMVSNKDDAMDLTSETFGKAFENLHRYRPDYAFSSWLFRIATNTSIDFLRKKKLNMVSIDDMRNEDGEYRSLQIKSDILNPEECSIKRQQREQIKVVINKLPVHYRKLIILRYFDELSYEEIARQVDSPLGTVKVQLFRARDLMFNILKPTKKNIYSEF